MKRSAVALVALSLAAVAFGGVVQSPRASVNVGNGMLCKDPGWQHLMRANGKTFQSQFHFQQYAAFGGVSYPLLKFDLVVGDLPGTTFCPYWGGQPDDGICVAFYATGLKPETPWAFTVAKNSLQKYFISYPAPSLFQSVSVNAFMTDDPPTCQVGDIWE